MKSAALPPLFPTAPLLCHPATPCPALHGISVSGDRLAGGGWRLRYDLQGDIARLRLPVAQPPVAADFLWQHTCCEAFLATASGRAYREFNFSPSSQWAVYDFSDIRQAVPIPAVPEPPAIFISISDGSAILEARLPADLLPPLPGRQHLGLSAVIETAAGEKSYWALAHPAAQPDFHRREAWLIDLPPCSS